ncbi:hypothetical protein K9L16_02415 [Candidatus Pacearchaeota archaeon]|nr:hypothetical protein [Candidatus Pacearchaeota archaeon]
MAKRILVDSKNLLQRVKEGVEQNRIMQEFGFKNSSQLKVAYTNALMEEGIVPELVGGRGSSKKGGPPKAKVNKRGSIVVPKEVVSEFGYDIGSTFEVKKTKSGISLKAKEIKPKTILRKRNKLL